MWVVARALTPLALHRRLPSPGPTRTCTQKLFATKPTRLTCPLCPPSHPSHCTHALAAPPAPPAATNSTNATSSSSSNTSCPGANHTVVSGDTCQALAGRYGTDVAGLRALNPGLNCSGGLRPGQVLCVAANATAGTTQGGPWLGARWCIVNQQRGVRWELRVWRAAVQGEVWISW